MRRLMIFTACCVGTLAALSAAAAAPGPTPRIDRTQLQPRTCGGGRAVIDVRQTVVNDVDSGSRGNYWASDDYVRRIEVWRTGPGAFCAIVRYDGRFTTLPGSSPGGSGTLGAGIRGKFEGGYRMDFKATMRVRPARRVKGSIGTWDYRCDTAGNCPGSVYWVSLYFTGVTGDEFDWWGWIYRAGKSGTWLNAITGTKGDIVGDGKKKAKGGLGGE